MADGPQDERVLRAEFEALKRRVQELEARLAAQSPPRTWPEPRPEPPAARPPVALPLPAPMPAPAAPLPRSFPLPPAPVPPPRAARPAVSMETLLGQRLAPRVGALLVFLASLFFLGVGIQRGWIGPLAQLGIAVALSAALLGIAHWLTRKKDYGTYPQVLEGTAACILYVTAFVAHALPYYARATGLDEVGGGLVMAVVALGTVALALWRDARVIVNLGYGLAFLTAAIGWGVLPQLTVPYVGLLGVSLALVVARKRWSAEGLLGSLATGALFVGFAIDAVDPPGPAPWFVLLCAAPAVVAFLWLSLRRSPGGADVAAGIAGFTLAWAVGVSIGPVWGDVSQVGVLLFAWSAAAVALSVVAAVRKAEPGVSLMYGVAAVLLYLLAPWLLFEPIRPDRLAITLTYAMGALVLATTQRVFPRAAKPLWSAGLALAAAAAAKAVLLDQQFNIFGEASSFDAWVIFLALVPTLALLIALAPRDAAGSGAQRLLFAMAVGFVGLWAFALFDAPFAVTMYLLLVGIALVGAASRVGSLPGDARGAGLLLVAVAAFKTATYDTTAAMPRLEWWLAGLEAAIVAGSLLALHHLRPTPPGARPLPAAGALVGGSAIVVAMYLISYVTGPLTSVMLGLLGVAYLVGGFLRRGEVMYRYAGFGLLGLVLLRVFAVDLRETDLVVRALVFLVLGAILLGVGYAYARMNRAPAPPPSEPVEFELHR